jgi:phosphoribosylamine--glycine ligase/phosphoribosylformylglycinamidine cyclo-ligase
MSDSLRVLILGAGGREHALAWKLVQSDLVERVLVCPGNGGTASLPKTENVPLSGTDFDELVAFAVKHDVRSFVMVFWLSAAYGMLWVE